MGPAADGLRHAHRELCGAFPHAGQPPGPAAVDRSLRRRALRRDDLRRPGRRADVGVLVVDQVQRGLQLHRDGVRGPRLRQADPRRGGLHGHRRREMAGPPGLHQRPGRLGLLRRDQPLRLPSLRDAALDEPQPRTGHVHGTLGTALRADADLVGAIQGLARVPRPLPVPVAARAVRGRHLLSATGGRPAAVRAAAGGDERAVHPWRLQLRRLHAGSGAHADERAGRPHRAARRNELPPAGAAAGGNDDAGFARQDQRTGRGRGDGRGAGASAESRQA